MTIRRLLSPIKRFAVRQVNRFPVPWASVPILSEKWALQTPMLQPPTFLVSMPRSGSSWLGETLARSPGAAYLHEPFTKTFQGLTSQARVNFQFPVDGPPECFWQVAEKVRRGLPKFQRNIVRYPPGWRYSGRQQRRIIIKEVCVLGLPWFLSEFHPPVIHLVRHPAAVINSWARLGILGQFILGDKLDAVIRTETIEKYDAWWIDETNDPWIIAGALHGLTTNVTRDTLVDYPNSTEVLYEDLCREPMVEVKRLLEFCGLSWTEEIHEHIDGSTREDVDREKNPWGTSRDSSAMCERWMQELQPDEVSRIREGFDAMNPVYYQDDKWWP